MTMDKSLQIRARPGSREKRLEPRRENSTPDGRRPLEGRRQPLRLAKVRVFKLEMKKKKKKKEEEEVPRVLRALLRTAAAPAADAAKKEPAKRTRARKKRARKSSFPRSCFSIRWGGSCTATPGRETRGGSAAATPTCHALKLLKNHFPCGCHHGLGLWGLAWRAGRAALIAGLVVVVSLMFLEDRILFYPMKYPAGDWKPGGLVFEDAWFQASDGAKLHGWYVPKKAPGRGPLLPRQCGQYHAPRRCLAVVERTVGVSVLIFDYRGYGRSEGNPNEKGILADARAARQWLAQREKIKESDVVMMGESIGGAVAVDLAAKDGAEPSSWKARSTRFARWPPTIFPGCRSAG